ncbi:DUF2335 domain-containing protein [Anabaena sp. FACHB-709]|uniref:DUF2335 domain-containing protein n=2 Tax=Nostocaceae TaxID=1162 RepID=A0A1Z4KLJ3_ANAVA|nr:MULTISPECIES: DUF2335 domain-containing protein [Nostocaceae]BAY69848.1 hypothetical protein NIES23_26480 [Trichormus variabilis NIES-23]HBW33207.1 DUF2335 domain-containing protein [Nostoc sp. UBA8866]MBD2172781.1 DUF2335 domain-containing protein [Anabaena cylindrica FACHB-318]MBD2264594.1 DUF2335 domain-containing protein [Anabaena sp. FACHB-709]MBD2273710.1 DUF2335 domain-containing protein [Nostoc sp. PCC 7120 = FACHB-418]
MNEFNSHQKTEQTQILAQEDEFKLQQINAEIKDFMETLPSPIVLQQYNSILPNTSERIIAMAEREQEHKHKMREKLIDAQISEFKQERYERRLGQIFGFSLGVISIIAGSIIAIWESTLAGSFIGSTGVIALVFLFLFSSKKSQKNSYILELKNTDIVE